MLGFGPFHRWRLVNVLPPESANYFFFVIFLPCFRTGFDIKHSTKTAKLQTFDHVLDSFDCSMCKILKESPGIKWNKSSYFKKKKSQ